MMKNYLFFISAIAGLISACQSNTKKENTIDSASNAVVTELTNTEECYQMTKNKDTAMLTLKLSGTKVSGTLSYNLYEKDKNTGTISGTLVGDTILADYTFSSEGMQSVREVAFLKKDDQLQEGFGAVKENSIKVSFQNPKALTFGKSMVFEKTICK
jgi:hypothetical protein